MPSPQAEFAEFTALAAMRKALAAEAPRPLLPSSRERWASRHGANLRQALAHYLSRPAAFSLVMILLLYVRSGVGRRYVKNAHARGRFASSEIPLAVTGFVHF